MPKVEDRVINQYIREVDKYDRVPAFYTQYGPTLCYPGLDDANRNCTACKQVHFRFAAKK